VGHADLLVSQLMPMIGTMHEDRKHTIAALHGVTVGAASDDAWFIASSERGIGRRSSDPVNLDQKGCFFFQICSTFRQKKELRGGRRDSDLVNLDY
jgi:hypothetical protein